MGCLVRSARCYYEVTSFSSANAAVPRLAYGACGRGIGTLKGIGMLQGGCLDRGLMSEYSLWSVEPPLWGAGYVLVVGGG